MKDYSDILNSERPKHIGDDFSTRHPKMPRADRAKIFAPFAALSGHTEKAKAQERITIGRTEIDESRAYEINLALCNMIGRLRSEGEVRARVTYFEWDNERKGEGIYKTVSGTVSNIDIYSNILTIGSLKINFDCIYSILTE